MLNFKTRKCKSRFAKKMLQSTSKLKTRESASLASQPIAKKIKQAMQIIVVVSAAIAVATTVQKFIVVV